jgi:hypothetical protein
MATSIFILSHQDDEIGIFEILRIASEKKEKVYIFYMTNGSIKTEIPKNKIFYRDKESMSVLKNFGLNNKNVIFFGRLYNIPTCYLYKKLDLAYKKLNYFINKIPGEIKIYTHSWEGGNEDHDACNILIKKIFNKSKKIKKAYQFPLYNADTPYFFYKVQKFINNDKETLKIKTNLFNRIKYIKYLFYYKSQKRVWIGLYPFLIKNFLFSKYLHIQYLNKNLNFKKPHQGQLLYEKFKRCNYNDFRKSVKTFLAKN